MVLDLLREAAYISYHMNGGVTYEMALNLSYVERDVIKTFINEKIEEKQELLKYGIRF